MNEIQNQCSRRRFIATLSSAGAMMLLTPQWLWAADDIDPRIAKLVSKTIGVDAHNHVDVPLLTAELPGPKIDLFGEMKKSGFAAIVMTFAVDYQELKNPGDAYERFLNGLTAMDKALESNRMKRSLNLKEIRSAHAQNQPTVIQSVEGAHFLEGQIDRLSIAYSRGLRHLTLLHDHDASTPLGDVFTNPPQWGGLTSFGADVIKECNRLGILVDLSHADDTTLNAALKITTQPVLVSHTGLNTQVGKNEFMNKMMAPRLISKEQAKLVAKAGGVIGVWTHLADTSLAFAENIKAMVNVVGIDHVCIGTDTKITPAYRSPGETFKPQQGKSGGDQPGDNKEKTTNDQNKHTGPPGGDKNRNKMGGGTTNETWPGEKSGFYYTVIDALLKTGFSEEDIAKIGGDNYLRVFDAATAGH